MHRVNKINQNQNNICIISQQSRQSTIPPMRSFSSALQMQDFVSYKIQNSQKSQQTAQSFIFQTKYKKILSEENKKIIAKGSELRILAYESKKMKKSIWGQLLRINQEVQALEKKRYEFMNAMRQIKDKRQEEIRKFNQDCKLIENQQKQVQKNLQNSITEYIEYEQAKKQKIKKTINQNKNLLTRINEISPKVSQFLQNQQTVQKLQQKIRGLKENMKKQSKQIIQNKQKQEQLNRKVKHLYQKKEQEEEKQTISRGAKIKQFIDSLNKSLSLKQAQFQPQMLHGLVSQKQQQLSSYHSMNESESNITNFKLEQIGKKLTELPKINQNASQKDIKKIKQLEGLLDQLSTVEEKVQSRTKILENQEAVKDKQIRNLGQTLRKLVQNLK